MRAKRGFTLVEILIVVVILGILAAIVIPQFSDASEQAKESSLLSDLQTVRSQIELFKVHHNGLVPGAGGGTTPEQALTGLTNVSGATAAAPGAGVYGPYLQKLPLNPFTNGRGINGAAADGSAQGWTLEVDPTSATYGYFAASDANHSDL
ncbi:MAG: prepilin-type N-terminal cleavage/methylation domain-containing protein [Sedimentisphaerales bacterium]|nr:prepilin-type N-terminal cleavage/methylation domain-containing protein [Sedimentisphaerales bacterium]